MSTSKIKSVKPIRGRYLLVSFMNGVQKVYDCVPLLDLDRFQLLEHEAFFNAVTVDTGGYGVSWNDEMDLSEYELWNNGIDIDSEWQMSMEESAVQADAARA